MNFPCVSFYLVQTVNMLFYHSLYSLVWNSLYHFIRFLDSFGLGNCNSAIALGVHRKILMFFV